MEEVLNSLNPKKRELEPLPIPPKNPSTPFREYLDEETLEYYKRER